MINLLTQWFGITSIRRNLHKEFSSIDALLADLDNLRKILNNKWDRKCKLQSVLREAGKEVKKGFAIEQKIERILEPYINGDTKARDLGKILLLQTLLRDFRNDLLWKELLKLWNDEYALLDNNDDKLLKKNLQEQKRIASTLKKIIKLEFNDTHTHLGMSADAHIHWHYLKKLWKKALDTNVKDKLNLIHLFEDAAKKEKISAEDMCTIKIIMQNYFSGKWSEVRAFTKFEELLLMLPEEKGHMYGFEKKAQILCTIISGVNHTSKYNRGYYLKCLDNIARHNLAHNITHIEMRHPTQRLGGLEFFASLAREIEQKYNNKITIRFIESAVGYDFKRFLNDYNDLPKILKRYFVAIESYWDIDNKKRRKQIKRLPFKLCVHAGEFFSQKDFPHRTKSENVKYALFQIKHCLELPNLYRIGHANILGLDIEDFLYGSSPQTINELRQLQKSLIYKIRRRGVFIETNPTSNILIRGITYEEHPISEFSRCNLKFAISTDDRVIFDTTLKKEFYRIARAMKWTEKEIEKAAKMQKEAMLK